MPFHKNITQALEKLHIPSMEAFKMSVHGTGTSFFFRYPFMWQFSWISGECRRRRPEVGLKDGYPLLRVLHIKAVVGCQGCSFLSLELLRPLQAYCALSA